MSLPVEGRGQQQQRQPFPPPPPAAERRKQQRQQHGRRPPHRVVEVHLCADADAAAADDDDSADGESSSSSPPPPPPTTTTNNVAPTASQIASFRRDGYVVFPSALNCRLVDDLNNRLEEVLRGRYDRGVPPDKFPRLIRGTLRRSSKGEEEGEEDAGCDEGNVDESSSNEARTEETDGVDHNGNGKGRLKGRGRRKKRGEKKKKGGGGVGPLGFSGNLHNVRVLQVINAHRSDALFREVATHPALGRLVSELAGWKGGARLAQDQVWAKPPGAPPLVFHRDSPYFMFTPPDVVTVWLALDDMDEELGPLQYVRGSHLWGDGRVGSSNSFFQSDGGTNLLRSAAEREGISDMDALEFVSMAGLCAGGISVHDGRTWHGSGRNASKDRPRRGLGLHFVPAEVRFTEDARKSSLWKNYISDIGKMELPESDFPVTWSGDPSPTGASPTGI